MLFAKVGDTVVGTCICSYPPYPDIGIIAYGDPMHIECGMPVARVGDTAIFSCGSGVIVSGSFFDISAGQPVARTGDTTQGCGVGTIVSSSINITQ